MTFPWSFSAGEDRDKAQTAEGGTLEKPAKGGGGRRGKRGAAKRSASISQAKGQNIFTHGKTVYS